MTSKTWKEGWGWTDGREEAINMKSGRMRTWKDGDDLSFLSFFSLVGGEKGMPERRQKEGGMGVVDWQGELNLADGGVREVATERLIR